MIKIKKLLNIFYMLLVSSLLLSCTFQDMSEKSLQDIKTDYVLVTGNLSNKEMFQIIDRFLILSGIPENRTIDEKNGIYTKFWRSWPGYQMMGGQNCNLNTTMEVKRLNEQIFSLKFSVDHREKSCIFINASGVAEVSKYFIVKHQRLQSDVSKNMQSKIVQEKSEKIVAAKKREECGISGTDTKTKTSDKKTISKGSKESSKQIQIDPQKTKVVIATGVGETEHEAIKDAGRSAVKEAVGMFLVSETLVENDELIKDEVLSVSDGFVSKFRTISKGKDEDGLVEVKASITVVIGKVASKLRGMNVSMKDVGSEEFVAVELDKFSSASEYRKMFEEVVVKPLYIDDTYELEITDFKPLDVEEIDPANYLGKGNIVYFDNQKEKTRVDDGELMPYYISFTISLSDSYIRKVKSLFNSFSCEPDPFDEKCLGDKKCKKTDKSRVLFGTPREFSPYCFDSEGKIADKFKKVGSNQFTDQCMKRIYEFTDFRIKEKNKYGNLIIGNLDFSDYCSEKPRHMSAPYCSLMEIHESAYYIAKGDSRKKDFHPKLHHRLECYSRKYPSGKIISKSDPKICYFKDFNNFAYFNFIKAYQLKLQHRKLITSLFNKYYKYRPMRVISIKLLDKDNKFLKGRVVAGSYRDIVYLEGLQRDYQANATEDLLKEFRSLPASDMVPSRSINDVRKFYKYKERNNIHKGFVLDINKNESDFYTLYTNKFENTIFLYLSEDDILKMNDISLNYNIRCALPGTEWTKRNNNNRYIQSDLCTDLF